MTQIFLVSFFFAQTNFPLTCTGMHSDEKILRLLTIKNSYKLQQETQSHCDIFLQGGTEMID